MTKWGPSHPNAPEKRYFPCSTVSTNKQRSGINNRLYLVDTVIHFSKTPGDMKYHREIGATKFIDFTTITSRCSSATCLFFYRRRRCTLNRDFREDFSGVPWSSCRPNF